MNTWRCWGETLKEMKVIHNLNFKDVFYLRLNKTIYRYIVLYISIILVSLLLIFNIKTVFLFILFLLCVASMQHLKTMPWLGFDLNIIATVLITYYYGLVPGSIISLASVVGLITVAEADNLLFDFIAGSSLVPLVIILFTFGISLSTILAISTIWYVGLGFLYHYYMGTLEFNNFCWLSSYLFSHLIIVKYFF